MSYLYHHLMKCLLVVVSVALLLPVSQAEILTNSSADEMTTSESLPPPQPEPIATSNHNQDVVVESLPPPQPEPIATSNHNQDVVVESLPPPQPEPIATSNNSSKVTVVSVPSAQSESITKIGVYKSAVSERMSISTFVGNSKLIKLTDPVSRIAVGDSDVADFKSVSATEVLILGKTVGTTNIIFWHKNGKSTIADTTVSVDLSQLEELIKNQFPRETEIHLSIASGSVVLSGSVADALTAEAIVSLAEAHVRNLNRFLMRHMKNGMQNPMGMQGPPGSQVSTQTSSGGIGVLAQVINLLKIRDGQQVMLDVRIAEISKTLLDQLGVGVTGASGSGDHRWNIISGYLQGAPGIAKLFGKVSVDGTKNDSLIKILAEPTLVATSGQEGSFLVGGKVFIPVPQSSGGGASIVTLVEREFGVGLKFIPTVLDGGRISLKVAPEVSEIGKSIIFKTTGSAETILPLFTTRRVSTTVQLTEGQSLVIGGLVRNNITETVKAFPFLGELPIIGALFRSTEFTSDRTELVILVSPSLVKATNKAVTLPTDKFVQPTRAELFMNGKLEGVK